MLVRDRAVSVQRETDATTVSSFEFQVERGPKSKVQGPRSAQINPQILNPKSHTGIEAEGYFLKAVAIARQQQAKSLVLWAVMSLAYLWLQQGKEKQTHEILVEIFSWFTEGFDTKDLQEAKALIEGLKH